MRLIKCPQCKKETEYSIENHFRPFCSERCQLIDLGDWATEKYLVPGEKLNPVSEHSDEISAGNSDDQE